MRYLIKFYKLEQVSVLLSRNGLAKLWDHYFIKIVLTVCGKVSKGLASGTYQCLFRIHTVLRAQGLKGAVQYMKCCTVAIQQVIGGHRISDISQIAGCRVSRTRRGLPRCIPRNWRRGFYNNPEIIRLCLSIFSLTRVLLFESKVNLSTITNPYTGSADIVKSLIRYIPAFFRAFGLDRLKLISPDRSPIGFFNALSCRLFPIFKSGPGCRKEGWSTEVLTLYRTHSALTNLGLDFTLNQIALLTHNTAWLNLWQFFELTSSNISKFPVGRLGLKQEMAGKMRVFAMVDAWTQWLMYPIHKFIFRILKKIPMDGTFNQSGPLSRVPWNKGFPLFSLDLSAATDRLPLALQTLLIDYVFPGLGKLWAKALVGREYLVPKSSGQTVRYAVGQPMGALSSWASLALTHHFIVQVAAWQAGVVPAGTLFKQYALLGDDILLWSAAAAKQYVKLMTLLGVTMGLHKSLISPKGLALEFAKRTIYKGVDVSAISLKELCAALYNVTSLVGFGIKYKVSLAGLHRLAGKGYQVTGSLNKGFQSLSLLSKAILVCQLKPLTVESFQQFLGRVNSQTFKGIDIRSIAIFVNYIMLEMANEMNNLVQSSLLEFHKTIKGSSADFARELPDKGVLSVAALESAANKIFADLPLETPLPMIHLESYEQSINKILVHIKMMKGVIISPDLFYNMGQTKMMGIINKSLFLYWKGNALLNAHQINCGFERNDVVSPRFGVTPKMMLTYNRWSKVLFPLLRKTNVRRVVIRAPVVTDSIRN